MPSNSLTLVTAASRVADRLHNPTTVIQELAKVFLNETMQFIIAQRGDWTWLSSEGAFSTTIGQGKYVLDNSSGGIGVSDLRRFLSVRIESQDTLLTPISIEKFIELYTDTQEEQGLPENFAVWSNQLWLGPEPDQVYTIDYLYYKQQADLTDTQSPPWPPDYNWIWLKGAEARVLAFKDDQRSDVALAEFRDGIRRMVGDNEIEGEEIRTEPFSHGQLIWLERSFPPNKFGPGF